jgi:PncC family amidohydrolase
VNGSDLTEESAALDVLVRDLVERLGERGETVAVAESLTAGMVLERLGRVPGVSMVLRGGMVAYATDLKTALLGVLPAIIADHGAVSLETAVAMASGVRQRCVSDWGMATTGVAGPDPQEGKPPGTVFVAVDGPVGTHWHRLEVCQAAMSGLDPAGLRERIRLAATRAALRLLFDLVGGVSVASVDGESYPDGERDTG